MNLQKVILFLSTLVFSTLVLAQSTQQSARPSTQQSQEQLLNQITELSREIRQAAITSEASKESLLEARNLMMDALDLIQSTGQGGGAPNKECIEFAYQKYFMQHSSAVATDKAIAACKIIEDLDIARFSFDKYYASVSSSPAMDKAAQASGIGQVGKLDMIQFAYEKYFLSMSSAPAMDAAAKGVVQIQRGELSCLQMMYEKYFASMNSKAAMDKSFVACADNKK